MDPKDTTGVSVQLYLKKMINNSLEDWLDRVFYSTDVWRLMLLTLGDFKLRY